MPPALGMAGSSDHPSSGATMRAAGRFSIPKVLVLVALGALGLAARPAVAEAQAIRTTGNAKW